MNKVAEELARIQAAMAPAEGDVSPRRQRGVLKSRSDDIRSVSSAKQMHVTLKRLEPEVLRMWEGHNRHFAALTPENCADLIDGFRAHDQQIPAIGRLLPEGDEHYAELVVGARRLFTATYLRRPLTVHIREMDDREAFFLQNLENRDRKDVTNLEQAKDYARALALYFDSSTTTMADHLNMDRTLLSRLLALAKLPEEIVSAYADPGDLVVHHGTLYRKLLDQPVARKRMIREATSIAKAGGLPGKGVLAALQKAAAGPREKVVKRSVGAAEIASMTSKQMTIKVTLPVERSDESAAAIEADMVALVREALAGQH